MHLATWLHFAGHLTNMQADCHKDMRKQSYSTFKQG